MREISFQGRSFDGEWYEGNLVKHGNQANIVFHDKLGNEHWHEVDEVTVCQFTGLHDKYGTKIYEGDIVKFFSLYDKIGKIIYEEGAFNIDDNWDHYYLDGFDEEIEVIGNIHINPELLEGE